jgi:3-phytase
MPTITLQQGLNGYTGTQDTHVNWMNPSTSFNQSYVSVDRKTGNNGKSQGLLQFTGLDLPDGALVTSAVLTLNTLDPGAGATLYQMTRAWSEASTYDSLGSGVQVGVETDPDPEAVTGFVSNTGLINIDVKDSLQSWADGAPNYGWYLKPSSGSNDGWDFSSSEGTVKPKLTVTYTLDGTIPPSFNPEPEPEPVPPNLNPEPEPEPVPPNLNPEPEPQPPPPAPLPPDPDPTSPFSGTVLPKVETASMRLGSGFADGDVADDPTIWFDQLTPSRSVVIGVGKDTSAGGLYVFDLAGNIINTAGTNQPLNNVDLRYDFKLGASSIVLVGATNRATDSIDFWRFNPTSRDLEPIGSVATGFSDVYGFTMSEVNGVYSAYVSNPTNGDVRQFKLDGSSGTIQATVTRTLDVGTSTIEGMVVDDQTGHLYVAQETGSIWKYGPTGTTREQVDSVSSAQLSADIEGLAIYYATGGEGYLLASSQGSSSFAAYDRGPGNDYLGSFKVGATSTIDAVTGTDGMDVTNLPLGSAFPNGAVVVHDHTNTGGTSSNFKLVDWAQVANLGGLTIDRTVHDWMV